MKEFFVRKKNCFSLLTYALQIGMTAKTKNLRPISKLLFIFLKYAFKTHVVKMTVTDTMKQHVFLPIDLILVTRVLFSIPFYADEMMKMPVIRAIVIKTDNNTTQRENRFSFNKAGFLLLLLKLILLSVCKTFQKFNIFKN